MNRWNFHFLLRNSCNLTHLLQLHAQAIVQGLHPHHQHLSCQILNLYQRLGLTEDAHNLFDEIPNPDIVSLASLISLHLSCNQPQRAIAVFSDIFLLGLQPDGFTVVGALSASGRLGHLRLGKSVHAMVYRRELGSETVVGNAMIDMYSRNGMIVSAGIVFQQMDVRDAVSWSTMLNGYAKCIGAASALMIRCHVQEKQPIQALHLFKKMRLEGHQPTVITVVGVLSACADVGALDLGRALHGYAIKIDSNLNVTLCNALIDMYSKSGNIEMAEDIFDGVPFKDVYTWTSMISGFGVHGDARRAIEVFYDMLSSGTKPNLITFLAVLLACSHGGLVAEGRKLFYEMKTVYKYKPQLQHFGCMIDLLGRAGLLRDAELLIQDMGMDVDCVIWRSLLSASLVHGDFVLAELAGKKIIEQEPDDDSVYVLMWNMYASSNKWKEALEMRKKMRDLKLLKSRGCSLIEVDGIMHEFLVDDKMHCQQEEMNSVMEGIGKHLRTTFDHLLHEEHA
ncbi:Pentatricopeptide repeat-containing protein [Apostasia shenzhenica]|uniref:Pentatricopeptide repeat-containing protein n=1 Tax=Apostasia shenzhenica TaxID=1088818 RepID=A0A2I0AHF2_9ASPA|nr:Pentatricopeptide repeat-containing protein [Apostasia shenzhenica]